jgi:N-succinyldiaminopimelate aminotransferase
MLNRLIAHLTDYPFDRLRLLLDRLSAPEGIQPLVLSVGEPRHAPPPTVAETVAAHADDWGRYPPVNGTPEFRAAVVGWLERRYRLPRGFVDPERNVLPVAGTREALFLIAQTVVPQEKNGRTPAVLMPNPCYQVYCAAAVFGRAEPVYLRASADGYLCDLAALKPVLLDRTALLYLCSPSNPEGAVATLETLSTAIRLARTYGFVVCVDECYTDIYDGEPPPGALEACAVLRQGLDNVIVFHSLSKRSNVPGLRSGFVAGDGRVLDAFRRLRAFGGATVPLPILCASTVLWQDDSHAEANRALYRAKFDRAQELLDGRFGFVRPAGAFFLWLNVGDGERAARALWTQAAVRVLPGAYLAKPCRDGTNPATAFIRVALVDDIASTEDALRRLCNVL